MNGCIQSKGVWLFSSEIALQFMTRHLICPTKDPDAPLAWCQIVKMTNNPRTSRLLLSPKWLQPPNLSTLSPCLGRVQQNNRQWFSRVNVILTLFEIYDEETATMLNISIHCQGSSVNIISSKVFSNSVKLQRGAKPTPPGRSTKQSDATTTVLGSIIFLSKFK